MGRGGGAVGHPRASRTGRGGHGRRGPRRIDGRRHRLARGLYARRRPGGDHQGARQSGILRVEEDRLRRGRPRRRVEAGERRGAGHAHPRRGAVPRDRHAGPRRARWLTEHPLGDGDMDYRTLGRTGRRVSTLALGTWQFGGDWGEVSREDAFSVLDASYESGVTLFDTADVYGDGQSERLIGEWLKANPDADVF